MTLNKFKHLSINITLEAEQLTSQNYEPSWVYVSEEIDVSACFSYWMNQWLLQLCGSQRVNMKSHFTLPPPTIETYITSLFQVKIKLWITLGRFWEGSVSQNLADINDSTNNVTSAAFLFLSSADCSDHSSFTEAWHYSLLANRSPHTHTSSAFVRCFLDIFLIFNTFFFFFQIQVGSFSPSLTLSLSPFQLKHAKVVAKRN